MSIYIIEVFVKLRALRQTNQEILNKLEKLEYQTDKNTDGIEIIFKALNQLLDQPKEPRKRIGFMPDEID